MPGIVVVGNPDNRRVRLFAAAVVRAGLAEPRVIAWRQVAGDASGVSIDLGGTPLGLVAGELVRIESPGEDAEVDRLLRGAPVPAEHGEIVGLADWYRGFAVALARIGAAAARAGARLLTDPEEVLVMGDKRACHARLSGAGVPVPPALPQVHGYRELRAAMADAGWSRVFVKPAYGSSASGVLALAVRGRSAGVREVRATTSVELVPGTGGPRLYNCLRVRHYADEAAIASIVDNLAPDGLQVERWYPKAALAGRVLDLRVVVVAGRATHAVARCSRSPMTNLHLGGTRGELAAVRAAAGPQYDAALRTCEAVAGCFPRSSQVGVDLMFAANWRGHAVAEVNAFGDLLPGLLVAGRDTYDEQVAALARVAG
ncbi:MAG: STM4014 family protein [Micromonosporaceae bacterium]|nr:STM4014 family protein [Micromonosporaceae bacterium]